jgi:hypothetical protein
VESDESGAVVELEMDGADVSREDDGVVVDANGLARRTRIVEERELVDKGVGVAISWTWDLKQW